MAENTYNGWTNYATWRIYLELIEGFADALDLSDYAGDPWGLADLFDAYADEVMTDNAQGLALDYARAFLADVNCYEMAVGLLSDANLLEGDGAA
jgi:hypothetical protein